jgi:hypothetical protein
VFYLCLVFEKTNPRFTFFCLQNAAFEALLIRIQICSKMLNPDHLKINVGLHFCFKYVSIINYGFRSRIQI